MSDYPPETQALIDDGSIEECPHCGALSAYAWCDTNIPESERGRIVGELDYDPTLPVIYSIGAASGLGEFQCGKCGTHWVRADSPLNHPCYTHSED